MEWPAGEAAFVTGAAGGIGLGIARALVAAGARVAVADIDEARLDEAAAILTDLGGEVVAVQLDVSDPDAWAAAADRAEAALGPISILVNNAGVIGGTGPVEQAPLKAWQWVQRINVEAQFLGTATFLPRFKERGTRAHILNTASMAGLVPMPMVAAYVTSKFASVGFTMALREELRDTNVGVSLLTPGTVATALPVNAGAAEAALLSTDMNTAAAEANVRTAANGADPDRVGEQVVEAISAGDFMIVTHGDWLPLVSRVTDEVVRAFTEMDDRHGIDPASGAFGSGDNPVAV